MHIFVCSQTLIILLQFLAIGFVSVLYLIELNRVLATCYEFYELLTSTNIFSRLQVRKLFKEKLFLQFWHNVLTIFSYVLHVHLPEIYMLF